MFDYQPGSSPLAARGNFPVLFFGITVAVLVLAIVVIWFVFKKINDYRKSDKYLDKEMSRQTTAKDIHRFAKKYEISKEDAQLLLQLCTIKKVPNFYYYIYDIEQTTVLFKEFYLTMRAENMPEESINRFFQLVYKIETYILNSKKMNSSRQIPLNSFVFYLTPESEQYPFTLTENAQDYFSLEIPQPVIDRGIKPQVLEKMRLIYKNPINGISYYFISRAMRFQSTGGRNLMICAHSEDMVSQSHRHFRRESITEKCTFSPAQVSVQETRKKSDYKYVIVPKKYEGTLKDISGGGCCIATNFPIKEQQLISVDLTALGITDSVIGTIIRTRKINEGAFALHIQFIEISTKAQNRIYAKVYKYEF